MPVPPYFRLNVPLLIARASADANTNNSNTDDDDDNDFFTQSGADDESGGSSDGTDPEIEAWVSFFFSSTTVL